MPLVEYMSEYSTIISETRLKNSDANKYTINVKLLPIKVKIHKALKKSGRDVFMFEAIKHEYILNYIL